MSKRILRSGKKYEQSTDEETEMKHDLDYDSDETVILSKRKKLYISSDSDETPKKKKKTLLKKKVNKEKKITVPKNEPSTSKQEFTATKKIQIIITSSSDSEDEKPKKKKIKIDHDINRTSIITPVKSSSSTTFNWTEADLLTEKEGISKEIARSMIKLFKEGNTIPFIARYRRHLTGDMTAEQLRTIKEVYDNIVELKNRSNTILKNIEKTGNLTPGLEVTILSCKNLEELEHIYAPFKEPSKKSLAERAKNLGLEPAAISLLNDMKDVNLYSLIKQNGSEGIRNIDEVKKSIMNLLGHMICHDSEVLTFLRDLKDNIYCKIETKISPSAKKNTDNEQIIKFDRYFDKSFVTKTIQPHQILAINRGESQKILVVKVLIPDFVFMKFKDFCENKWSFTTFQFPTRKTILNDTLKEIYSKSIVPLLSRRIRSDLKTVAHKSAIEIFAKNLKQLLLEPPIKGKVIMGIDPGLKLGCKVAVISPQGDVLNTYVIYPHINRRTNDAELIRSQVQKYNCSLIVIGNGKACRETETWLSNLIQKDFFKPYDVSYSIVDESGASIYSCSEEAKKEFPKLDPLQISAISLARRVQDPLAELVKIDPKNLGVGMYQHDINHKILDNTLSEVISECVSFVGVDINTASYNLLRRVAGLTSQRAENVIKYRQEKGRFTHRSQIKNVKGIGDKVYEQCAGFLRIMPSNSSEAVKFYQMPNTTPLDATDIHPEAYDIAQKFLNTFNLSYKNIGQPDFMKEFKAKIITIKINEFAKQCNTTEQTVKLIIDALCKPLSYDLRTENPQGPIFKKEITKVTDLKPGMVVTGRVKNVVVFGAFVDIGIGRDGLIYKTHTNGYDLQLGQRVEVEVINVDTTLTRISLKMLKVLI